MKLHRPQAKQSSSLFEFSEKPNDVKSNYEKIDQMDTHSYIVASGDTLWNIAERLLDDGNLYKEIAEYNEINNPNQISVGQILHIPSKSSSKDLPENEPEDVKQATSIDRKKILKVIDPLFDFIMRQDSKRRLDLLSTIKQEASKSEDPEDNLLLDAVLHFAQENPKRDGESWAGWCASLMFRFGMSTSDFRDGINDAPSAITAARKSNIVSKDSALAPKGAFHWWDVGRHGHVGLDVKGGGTHVFMATRKLETFFGAEENAIGLTSIESYNQSISGIYLGWSLDYVGGTILDERKKNT